MTLEREPVKQSGQIVSPTDGRVSDIDGDIGPNDDKPAQLEDYPVPPADFSGVEDDDDAVALYLREIRRIPLLTGEQEVDLAQRMERGIEAQAQLDLDRDRPIAADEEEELKRIVAEGDAAREYLLRANQRLVVNMAKKYLRQGVPFLDLIQEGNLGLIKAADKFDHRRGHKFSTYATWWVRQAVTRALADQSRTIRVPVHMSTMLSRMYRAARRLEQEFGREPSVTELALELFEAATPETIKKVEFMLRVSRAPQSLELAVGEDGDSELGEFITDETEPDPHDAAELTFLREDVNSVLKALPPREALVLELRYGLRGGEPCTLKEVGEIFGLTRERVRQIETKAKTRLRHPRRAGRLRTYVK